MNKHYIRCGYAEIPEENFGHIKAKKLELPEGYYYSGQYILIGENWYPIIYYETVAALRNTPYGTIKENG